MVAVVEKAPQVEIPAARPKRNAAAAAVLPAVNTVATVAAATNVIPAVAATAAPPPPPAAVDSPPRAKRKKRSTNKAETKAVPRSGYDRCHEIHQINQLMMVNDLKSTTSWNLLKVL